jgi:hypothetical protein
MGAVGRVGVPSEPVILQIKEVVVKSIKSFIYKKNSI